MGNEKTKRNDDDMEPKRAGEMDGMVSALSEKRVGHDKYKNAHMS